MPLRLLRMEKVPLRSASKRKALPFPEELWELSAFVDPHDSEMIVIVNMETPDDNECYFYGTLNHEFLHTLMHRLDLAPQSLQFDAFVGLQAERLVKRENLAVEWQMTWLGFR